MRRVVVTGLGLVTPLASDVKRSWEQLVEGQSGAGPITKCDVSDIPARVACEVGRGDGSDGTFNPDDFLSPKDQRRVDDFILYGIAAAQEAVEDAGWTDPSDEDKLRTGAMIGAGIGGLPAIEEQTIVLHERGPRRVSPHFIPSALINLVSGQVQIRYGYKGPNHSVVTACSTGAHAIGDAARLIALDDADVMVAGGAEAAICRIGLAGFAQAKALSTNFNDEPTRASRPWDKDRDGFVMGEGAGIVILEELEHALARGAKIYAEITGYGATSDGYDMVAPSGEGAIRCMQLAMSTIKGPIDYINTHGTSTPVGDVAELGAIRETFGDDCPLIGSTKSLSGHSLGAAGVHEAIYSLLMMQNDFVTASANIETLDEKAEGLPLVVGENKEMKLNRIMSNSFGFGGTNACLVFDRYEG